MFFVFAASFSVTSIPAGIVIDRLVRKNFTEGIHFEDLTLAYTIKP